MNTALNPAVIEVEVYVLVRGQGWELRGCGQPCENDSDSIARCGQVLWDEAISQSETCWGRQLRFLLDGNEVSRSDVRP